VTVAVQVPASGTSIGAVRLIPQEKMLELALCVRVKPGALAPLWVPPASGITTLSCMGTVPYPVICNWILMSQVLALTVPCSPNSNGMKMR